MVELSCHTNLDIIQHVEKWPKQLPHAPRVGDLIQSAHNWGHCVLQLEVHGVTWKQSASGEWYADVELHLPKGRFGTLTDFFEWYGRITGRGKSFFI